MYRPIVFNRHLNSKWSSKNNEIMVDKLRNIKPSVNMQCPESFNFYKTQFHKTAERNTKSKLKKNRSYKLYFCVYSSSIRNRTW